MIGTLILIVLVISLITAWITIRVKGRTVKAEWVTPLWGIGGCGVIIGGVLIWYAANLRIYDQCVDSALRTAGARQSFEKLYDAVATLGDEGETFAAKLRIDLDEDLPRANVLDCEHP